VKSDITVERGDYLPDYNYGTRNMLTGFVTMEKAVSRKRLPSGRPSK
jgi:hypothetical protein